MKKKNTITGRFETYKSPDLLKSLEGQKVCIYMLQSPTDKIYVGQTRRIHGRINAYIAVRCYGQPFLFSSLKKYGFYEHKFFILESLEDDISQDILDAREHYFWKKYKDLGHIMLNAREPDGAHRIFSEETKKKMSQAAKGRIPWNKGRKTGPRSKGDGNGKPRRSYIFYKNGERIVVDNLKKYCLDNKLGKGAMIQLANKKGFMGRTGRYRGYTNDLNIISGDRRKLNCGINHPSAKLNRETVLAIRHDRKNGIGPKELSIKYNVRPGTLGDLLGGKSYRTCQ